MNKAIFAQGKRMSASKTHNTLLLLLVVISVLLGSCGSMETTMDDENKSQSHNVVRRDSLPITYYISSAMSDEAADDVKAAFAQWEHDLDANVFKFGGLINVNKHQISNQYHPLKNVIIETDASGKIAPPIGDGYDAIARTFVHGISDIRDTDVVFYEFKKNYVEGRGEAGDIYSVKTVMMHEIGRMLFGGRDGDDEGSVLNNPVYPKGHVDEKTKLSKRDIKLFYEVYGDML